jgi:carboxyl-terminal processing protease
MLPPDSTPDEAVDRPLDPSETAFLSDTEPDRGDQPAPVGADGYPSGPGNVSGPAPVPVSGRRGGGGRAIAAVAVALVAVLGGGAMFVSGYALGNRQAIQPGTSASDQAQFQAFWDAYHKVHDDYALGPIADKTLIQGAIKGLVESIGDPYSSYLTPEDFSGTLQDIEGQFEGIGAEIGTVDKNGKTVDCATFGPDCRLDVIAPIEGSPAEQAGLKAGDVIDSVDGTSVDGLTPDEARNKVRGKAGTSVVLHIERKDVAPFDVTIVRAKIQRKEVITKDLGGGSIGYVKLTGFSENGADEFVNAVKADVAKGDKKLIIDLRGDPGGFIDAANKVASQFIASGPVFWQQDVKGNQTATNALGGGAATDASIKVMLLVDKGSASASEIVAGALHDTGRATLVGETTFGKGTVQTWIQLGTNGADGGIKLTVAKWLTPNKTWVHKVGITPDVPVTVPADNPAGKDPVLDKALELLGATAGVVELRLAA